MPMRWIKAGIMVLVLAPLFTPGAAAISCDNYDRTLLDVPGMTVGFYKSCSSSQSRLSVVFQDPGVGVGRIEVAEEGLSGIVLLLDDGTAYVTAPGSGVTINGHHFGIDSLPSIGCLAAFDRDGRYVRVCHVIGR